MSYQEFLNTLISPIQYFISWLSMVADVLIHNYYFITMLGIVLFISLFWLVYYLIHDFIYSRFNDYEDFNDRYKKYVELQEIKKKYLDNHRLDVFEYLYDYKILQQQVINAIYQKHPQIMLENKINNFKLSAEALRKMKLEQVSDDKLDNDNDADIFISNPKVELVSKNELLKLKRDNKTKWLKDWGEELKRDTDVLIESIMFENKDLLDKLGVYYDVKSNLFTDSKTGEVVDDIVFRYKKMQSKIEKKEE